jgi:SRSO17 transposase
VIHGCRRFGGPTMEGIWKSDLERWLSPFISALPHKTRVRMRPAYVAGLIGAGDRKSVQPMAMHDREVMSYDQLHHFISSAVWDAASLERVRYSPKLTEWSAATALGRSGLHHNGKPFGKWVHREFQRALAGRNAGR